jgi:hypothetical protein
MNVEECLREIRGKAALLRYLASCATLGAEVPDPDVFLGLGIACEEIEYLTKSVSRTLTVVVLASEIKAERGK